MGRDREIPSPHGCLGLFGVSYPVSRFFATCTGILRFFATYRKILRHIAFFCDTSHVAKDMSHVAKDMSQNFAIFCDMSFWGS
jgi:hypothetical protein